METYTAFDGVEQVCQGPLFEVVARVKKRLGKAENSAILIFSDVTGKTMDINFQGSEKDVLGRLEMFVPKEQEAVVGPGRPKLGVVSREISLMPRHWEWLATQPGGASATLRSLIEDAKKRSSEKVSGKQLQECAYRFMSVMAGDREGFEEALRALYRLDRKSFLTHIRSWPRDIKNHVMEMTRSCGWEK
jgi:hypothetical protein